MPAWATGLEHMCLRSKPTTTHDNDKLQVLSTASMHLMPKQVAGIAPDTHQVLHTTNVNCWSVQQTTAETMYSLMSRKERKGAILAQHGFSYPTEGAVPTGVVGLWHCGE